VTGQMGAAGQSLHLSFGSSATSKLAVVVVAWGGLWTWLRSYYTRSNSVSGLAFFAAENRGTCAVCYSRR
jgi:hypothetical protein